MSAERDGGNVGRDAGLAALARSVERLGRRLGGVEETLAELAEQVEALDAEAGPRCRPASWLTEREPAQAEAMLRDLTGWLGAVFLRYADAALPACWLWHPDVVEELLWLRQAHAAAYAGRDAHIQRVADWHDRHRPGVARRIHGAGHLRCDRAPERRPPPRPNHRAARRGRDRRHRRLGRQRRHRDPTRGRTRAGPHSTSPSQLRTPMPFTHSDNPPSPAASHRTHAAYGQQYPSKIKEPTPARSKSRPQQDQRADPSKIKEPTTPMHHDPMATPTRGL
jgi:hypothetical protein